VDSVASPRNYPLLHFGLRHS